MEALKELALTYGVPLLAIVLVAVYVWRPKAKRRYDEDARIPFEEKDKDGK